MHGDSLAWRSHNERTIVTANGVDRPSEIPRIVSEVVHSVANVPREPRTSMQGEST